MRITSIEPVRRGRCRIWLNDEPAFLLTAEETEKLALFAGGEISDEKLEELISTLLTKKAISRAVDLLAARDRTTGQVRALLMKEEFPEKAIQKTLEWLQERRYLDDFRYACQYISLRQERESRAHIRQQLLTRGISGELVDLAFEEEGESDQVPLIMDILRKRHYPPDADEALRTRTIRYLAGKGFSWQEINKALTSFL